MSDNEDVKPGLENESRISKNLRHPALLLIIGFVLTGLLGAIFSNYVSKVFSRSEKQRALTADKIANVRKISEIIYARRERAIMLVSAIKRNVKVSAIERKRRMTKRILSGTKVFKVTCCSSAY